MTSRQESSQALQEAAEEGRLRFVEELADEQDYWLSLTDAARVTRTSETMVRRWVTTGRLPVKQEPVGINQRTRLVRASDVARLRPIVDPTAAITDEIHKLDLLSIPRQQAQILQEHQRLLVFVQEIRQRIEEHITQTRLAFEQGAAELQQSLQLWDHRFTLQQTAWQQVVNLQQQRYEALAAQVDHWTHETEQRVEHYCMQWQVHHYRSATSAVENSPFLKEGQKTYASAVESYHDNFPLHWHFFLRCLEKRDFFLHEEQVFSLFSPTRGECSGPPQPLQRKTYRYI